jgi:hypothetical protein
MGREERSPLVLFVGAIAFSVAPIREVKILTRQSTCTLLRNLLRLSQPYY